MPQFLCLSFRGPLFSLKYCLPSHISVSVSLSLSMVSGEVFREARRKEQKREVTVLNNPPGISGPGEGVCVSVMLAVVLSRALPRTRVSHGKFVPGEGQVKD